MALSVVVYTSVSYFNFFGILKLGNDFMMAFCIQRTVLGLTFRFLAILAFKFAVLGMLDPIITQKFGCLKSRVYGIQKKRL